MIPWSCIISAELTQPVSHCCVVQSRWRKSVLESRKCPHRPGESSASHVLCWETSGNCQRGNCLHIHLFPQRESDDNNWPTPPSTGCMENCRKIHSLSLNAAFLHAYIFVLMPNHICFVVALTDWWQKCRGDSEDEPVRPAVGCGPKVQCKYPHKYLSQYWYKQFCSDNKSSGLPQPLG